MSNHIDPLQKFRQKIQAPPPLPQVVASNPQAQAAAPDEYVAFLARDRVERLRIRAARGAPHYAPAYRYLLDVVSGGDSGSRFALIFNFMMVVVEGRNLQNVIAAIENDTAYFIQEFDPKRWKRPIDASEPFIESIEVIKNANEEMEERLRKTS